MVRLKGGNLLRTKVLQKNEKIAARSWASLYHIPVALCAEKLSGMFSPFPSNLRVTRVGVIGDNRMWFWPIAMP